MSCGDICVLCEIVDVFFGYRNGDVYSGHWMAGKKHGPGMYTYADGTKHDGVWLDDVRVDGDVGRHHRDYFSCSDGLNIAFDR